MGKKEEEDEKIAVQGSQNKELPEKEKKDKEPKVVFEVKNKCPYCGKNILTKKTKKLIHAGIPAEYEEKVVMEKDSQKTLEEAAKAGPQLDAKKKNKLHG